VVITVDGLDFINTFMPNALQTALKLFGINKLSDAPWDRGYLERSLRGYQYGFDAGDDGVPGQPPRQSQPGHPDARDLNIAVMPFLWSQDAMDTPTIVNELKGKLLAAYGNAQFNRKIAVVAHSWGTVLSYLAIPLASSEFALQHPDADAPVVPDLLVLLSSPIPTASVPCAAWEPGCGPVIDGTDVFTKSEMDRVSSPLPLAHKIRNFWAIGDFVSGPFTVSITAFDSTPWSDDRIKCGHGGPLNVKATERFGVLNHAAPDLCDQQVDFSAWMDDDNQPKRWRCDNSIPKQGDWHHKTSLVYDGGSSPDGDDLRTQVMGLIRGLFTPQISVDTGPDELAGTGWYSAASSGTDGVAVQVNVGGAANVACTARAGNVQQKFDSSITLYDGIWDVSCMAIDSSGVPAAATYLTGLTDTEEDSGNFPALQGDVWCTGTSTSPEMATASYQFKVDETPPDIRLTCPASAVLNATTAVTVSVTDAVSGVSSQSAPNGTNPLGTSTVGVNKFTVTAQDNAGNPASATCTYSVLYAYGPGFFTPPIAPPPIVNTVKAGSTVPVKFSLGDASGAYVSDLTAVSGLTYLPVACSTFAGNSVDVATSTSGGSGLRYDNAANQYVYNWKTPTIAGCYALQVALNDGTSHVANFILK
jgi:hypothetical protein